MNLALGILFPIIFIIFSSYIIWRSTDGFEEAADYLGRNFPSGIKGATLNAVASSMPEFLSTVFFLFYLDSQDGFSGGIGITAGSAIFNILVIPVAILIAIKFWKNNKGIPTDSRIIRRDGLFLLATNFVLIILLSQNELTYVHGLVLISIYLVYLIYIRRDLIKNSNVEEFFLEPIEPEGDVLQRIFGLEIASLLYPNKVLNKSRAWILLIISIIVLSLGTWLLVYGTELLGQKTYSLFGFENLQGLGIPLLFVSVILAAAASSIPDTMLSIRDAKKGNYEDSISNALGSNIFDISFALGVPLFLYTIIKGEPIVMSNEIRELSFALWVVLLAINLLVIPMLISGSKIGKRKGFVFLLLYVLFIVFVIQSAVHVDRINTFFEPIIDAL